MITDSQGNVVSGCGEWCWQGICADSDGKLGCGNSGKCNVCGATYQGKHITLHNEAILGQSPDDQSWVKPWEPNETYREQHQKLICFGCERELGHIVTKQMKDTSDAEGRKLNIEMEIRLGNGVSIDFGNGYKPYDTFGPRLVGGGYTSGVTPETYQIQKQFVNQTLAQSITDNQTGKNLGDPELWKQGIFSIQFKQDSLYMATQNKETLALNLQGTGRRYFTGWKFNNEMQEGQVKINWMQSPDMTAPYYQSHNTYLDGILNVDGTNWWNKATIGVKYYDTFIQPGMLETQTQIKFYDKDMSPITSNWEFMNKDGFNGSYQQFQKALDIVAEIRGQQPIYVVAKDKTGNISNKTKIMVQNIDALAPRIVNEAQLQTSTEWSKYKDIDYLFRDLGVGKVQVQFNSNSNTLLPGEQDYYQYANNNEDDTYTRSYRFTGNLQGQTGATIYVKDELGNTRGYRVNIYNLDNTAPTIVQCKTSKDNSTKETYIDITKEHDQFENGKDGQGVVAHLIKFIKQPITQKPNDPQKPQEQSSEWFNSDTIQVYESGWYFIYAKDAVGNISKPYAIYVDASTITYHANGGYVIDNPASFKIIDDLKTFEPHKLRVGIEFKREGYKIRSWNTKADNTGTRYELGQQVYLTESTTLYADWAKIYELQLELNNGHGNYQDADKFYGDNPVYLIPESFNKNILDPFKRGYNFRGWTIN